MIKKFDCMEEGEIKEYIGCKVVCHWAEKSLKMTQPVLIQSFEDEFEIPEGCHLVTTAVPGSILMKYDPKKNLTLEIQLKYSSVLGKLLHLMQWIRQEVSNTVQELSCHMTMASELNYKKIVTTMNYCVGTTNQGSFLMPARK